ncbi:YqiA/YcfP family alpha/beta fold hydrolase [Streptosporangium sp. NPDC001681]|uniref:alpha/beta hydrolase n=1 Tax=Streptosporangium sp. NPDC001681 TaxID=3154395 RepID=UPI00332F7DAD
MGFGEIREASFQSTSTGTRVDYRVLTPPSWRDGERLPLILHLHGAMSSSASLDMAKPLYDDGWTRDELPRAVVACPSTPTHGGFYIDHPDGPSWETLVADEFPQHLAKEHGPLAPETAVIGASMGGYGALKLGFRHPERYRAVAALSPAIFPGERMDKVPDENLPGVLRDLHLTMGAGANDPAAYAHNSVYGRLRANVDDLRRHRPAILVDCGGADEFRLQDGSEYLHRLLWDLDVAHDYRVMANAGHVGPAAVLRQADALRFIGRALSSPPTH